MILRWIRPTRAFVVGRSRPTPGVTPPLFSTLSSNELDDLKSRIKIKGDEIRELKSAGTEKTLLAPHIEELLTLKSQLPESEEPPKKKPKTQKKIVPKKQPPPQPELSESELRLNRLAKVDAMKDAGAEPFAYTFNSTHSAHALATLYDGKLENGEEDPTAHVAVAGRIMMRRVFGKLAFFSLQDDTGTIQLQLDKGRLGETFKVGSYFVL